MSATHRSTSAFAIGGMTFTANLVSESAHTNLARRAIGEVLAAEETRARRDLELQSLPEDRSDRSEFQEQPHEISPDLSRDTPSSTQSAAREAPHSELPVRSLDSLSLLDSETATNGESGAGVKLASDEPFDDEAAA
jgi:hypothetical protein